jgi:hypothetical protein
MCREVPDGGPLTEAGRRNLARMLAITAWHRETFCLVAVEGDALLGFGLGRVDAGDGLLPCVLGEMQELYVVPDAAPVKVRLAEAVIARLRALGTSTLRVSVAADDPQEQRFWAERGFEAEMIVMSNYEPA